MMNHHLFALCVVALSGAPAAAFADDKPIAAAKKSDEKPGKPHEGMPGHDGLPGRPGMPGHDGPKGRPETPDRAGAPGMRDGGATPGTRNEDRDGGAPRRPGYKNALRELYQDLKDGKLKKEELKGKLAQLQDTRSERRKEHRQELGKRWGSTLALPPARNELELHARRMAFLDRALVLAQGDTKPDKDKTIDRISKLIDKENARHDRAMARIQAQPATATTTASSAAAPSATSVAAGGSK
jgi:hypothetical protein